MRRTLPQRFFNRPTLIVARELLGKFLIRRIGKNIITVMITEVEAYDGPEDKASHASRGITPRTKIMFGEAGRFYVYFTYGMHWLLNVVTGAQEYPAAVLVRAGTARVTSKKRQATWKAVGGPARLTKHIRVGKSFNGKPATKETGLWFEDRGIKISARDIIAGTRIGVDYAGAWAKKPFNFKLRLPASKYRA